MKIQRDKKVKEEEEKKVDLHKMKKRKPQNFPHFLLKLWLSSKKCKNFILQWLQVIMFVKGNNKRCLLTKMKVCWMFKGYHEV